MAIKKFINSLNEDGVEGELIKGIIYSIIISFIFLAILYIVKLRDIDNFISNYGLYLLLSILSYALILNSMKHVNAYKKFPCMSGMMIGMTIGMVAGFLPGFYIGATNGMFYGSLFGMIIGISLGIINGKCCGIMGIMEGIMAGFMGGLMGAMTAVMMINDNIKLASIIVFIICSIILVGLSYMIYQETEIIRKNEKEQNIKNNLGNTFIIILSIILTAITIWLMIFGPRSILFQ